MIKNYFYENELSQMLAELLEKHLPEEVKKIYRGDFTVLPAPDELDACLPAIIIEIIDGKHEMANENIEVMYSQYNYRIFYVYPYTFTEVENEIQKAVKIIEKVGNILMFSNYLSIVEEASSTEAGGEVLRTEVTRTSLAAIEDDFLSLGGIPVAVGAIDATVHFRTYEREDKK